MLSAINGSANNWFGLDRLRLSKPSEIISKATKVAIPAILLLSAQTVQPADALGCIGCVICLTGIGMTTGPGGLACIPICVVCGVTVPIAAG